MFAYMPSSEIVVFGGDVVKNKIDDVGGGSGKSTFLAGVRGEMPTFFNKKCAKQPIFFVINKKYFKAECLQLHSE